MWIPVVVVALVATGVAMVRHMHMFQLNSYEPPTHWAWLAKHRSYWIPSVVALVIGLVSLWWTLVAAIVMLVWLLIAIVINRPRRAKAKKPLVYTSRVVRMLVTTGVFAVILVVVTLLMPAGERVFVGSLCFVLTPVWAVFANAVNSPIEAAVRQHYLNDAKRLLDSQPGLLKIGITGSYGKTSVKYYLTTLLKGHFNVLMTPESYNTPMGITKTIRADLRATHQIFVAEMGAKRVGEIKQDCDLVNPSIGIITAIGEQHLETFGSRANILSTKLELADAVRGKGTVYLNGDNEILRNHQPDQERQLYGLGSDNDTYAYDIGVTLDGSTFSVNHKGEQITKLATPLVGRHTIQNLAGAIAVALDLGVTETELRVQLKKLQPAPHRLALSRQGRVTIIDDAYNSNPAGARAALETLCLFDAQKILITPGMVELGELQESLNEEFGTEAVVCDHVYLVGPKQTEPIARGLEKAGYDPAKLTIVDSVNQAITQAYALPGPADKVILLENDLPDNY